MPFEGAFDYGRLPTDRLQAAVEQAALDKVADLVITAGFDEEGGRGIAVDDVDNPEAKLARALVIKGDANAQAEAVTLREILRASKVGTVVLYVIDREEKTLPEDPLTLQSQLGEESEIPIVTWNRNPKRDELEIMAQLLHTPSDTLLDTDVWVTLSLQKLDKLAEQNPDTYVHEKLVSRETQALLQQYMDRHEVRDGDVVSYRSLLGNYLYQLQFESEGISSGSGILPFAETTISIAVANDDTGKSGRLIIDREHPDETCGIGNADLEAALNNFLAQHKARRISESEFQGVYDSCIASLGRTF